MLYYQQNHFFEFDPHELIGIHCLDSLTLCIMKQQIALIIDLKLSLLE